MTSTAFGSRVVRHTALSFLGFAVPLALALVAIPITARALGPIRFGLLGLAWALIEYSAFVDFGLTRATIRFVADALVRAQRDVRQIVSVSLTTQALTALTGAVVMWLLADALAVRVFSIPPDTRAEAAAMFRVVAANIAVLLTMSGLRGALEGAQRFDLSTAFKIPGAAAGVLIPAIGAVAGASLPEILWWVFAVRAVVVAALVAVLPAAIEDFRWEAPRQWNRLRALFGYGGWLAVSGVANSVLTNFDRFALGAIVGVAAVGFYAAPYEAAARLLLIPVSMFAALFPALTALESRSERAMTTRVMESAMRQLVLVLLPITLVLAVFAREILQVWLGTAFATEATAALRLLAIGVFFNALAHLPAVFLYATGRPDIPAKLHMIEVALHVPITYALVLSMGITGAAAAWTIRVTVDALAHGFFAGRLGAWTGRSDKSVWRGMLIATTALAVGVGASWMISARAPRVGAGILVVTLCLFVLLAWQRALGGPERAAWSTLLSRAPLKDQPTRSGVGGAADPELNRASPTNSAPINSK